MKRWASGVLLLWVATSCKDGKTLEAEKKAQQLTVALSTARSAMAQGDFAWAIDAFKSAIAVRPEEAENYLLLAEAYMAAGKMALALLSIQEGEDHGARDTYRLKRMRADCHLSLREPAKAISLLLSLRDAELLSEPELLQLAGLQAVQGDTNGAYKSLEKAQLKKPSDPAVKVVEARVLFLSGEEAVAADLIDKVIAENPELAEARLLRARYFLNNGAPDKAELDLNQLGFEAAKRPEVVDLKAVALHRQKKYGEAAKLLDAALLQPGPGQADMLARLAETRLYQGDLGEAAVLVGKALALNPRQALALWVRGRAAQLEGDERTAEENFTFAQRADPLLGQALSSVAELALKDGRKMQAMQALERLLSLNEATRQQRLALAHIYIDTASNVPRAQQLAAELLKRDPNDAGAKAVKQRADKLGKSKQSSGLQVIGR
ncbi:MAG: tetratricopeptide repeat protein [Myxococcaceae bacterium]|nr:tetratricopeptide repeat protein [Myxococcaceae bacterium]